MSQAAYNLGLLIVSSAMLTILATVAKYLDIIQSLLTPSNLCIHLHDKQLLIYLQVLIQWIFYKEQ